MNVGKTIRSQRNTVQAMQEIEALGQAEREHCAKLRKAAVLSEELFVEGQKAWQRILEHGLDPEQMKETVFTLIDGEHCAVDTYRFYVHANGYSRTPDYHLGADGCIYSHLWADWDYRTRIMFSDEEWRRVTGEDEEVCEFAIQQLRALYAPAPVPAIKRTALTTTASTTPRLGWWARLMAQLFPSTRTRLREVERANTGAQTVEQQAITTANTSGPHRIVIDANCDIPKALELRGGDVLHIAASNLADPVIINIVDDGVIYVNVTGHGNTLCYSPWYNHEQRIVWAPGCADSTYTPFDTEAELHAAQDARVVYVVPHDYRISWALGGYGCKSTPEKVYIPHLRRGDMLFVYGADCMCVIGKVDAGAVIGMYGTNNKVVFDPSQRYMPHLHVHEFGTSGGYVPLSEYRKDHPKFARHPLPAQQPRTTRRQ